MNLIERNNVPYDELSFNKEMRNYIKKGGAQLRRQHSRKKTGLKCVRAGTKPRLDVYACCYYTGIRFIDEEIEHPNPNDPRKRTLDHKVPLAICFIEGWPIDKANHPNNLCYCLRAINNIKGSSTEESIKPIALWFRTKLIEQGFAHN